MTVAERQCGDFGLGRLTRTWLHRFWMGTMFTVVFALLPAWAFGQDLAANLAANLDDLKAGAAAARDANDIPKAVELYAKAVQADPNWSDGWRYLGFLEYGQDAYSDARDALSHYIDLMPQVAPARALRGLCEFETGEYDASLKDIQDGLALGAANDPRNVRTLRLHEALLLTRSGKFEDALASFASIAKEDTPDPEMLTGIGLAGLRVALLPKDVLASQREFYAVAGQAGFQFMAGDKASYVPAFQELFRRYPNAENAHYFYAYLVQQSDPARAVEEFEEELKVAPLNSLASAMLAWTLLMQDSPAQALPYAERANAEAPTSPVGQIVLGRSLAETGHISDGIQHLQSALQMEPENVEIHIALAEAYSESGRPEEARNERIESLKLAGSGGD